MITDVGDVLDSNLSNRRGPSSVHAAYLIVLTRMLATDGHNSLMPTG
jgi:hypothetical protein